MSIQATDQLSQIETQIREHEEEARRAGQSFMEHAWHIGRLLREASGQFDTGVAFGDWAEERFGYRRTHRWRLMTFANEPFRARNKFDSLRAFEYALPKPGSRQQSQVQAGLPSEFAHDPDIRMGDNLDLLPEVDSDSIDLIVTSPPYADLREGGERPAKYVEWFLPRAEEFLRVLKPTGSFILNIGDRTVKGFRHPYVYKLVLALTEEVGFLWADTYFWAKDNPMPGDFGKRAAPAVEYIYWFAKSRDYFWDDGEIRREYRSVPHLGKPKSDLREPKGQERDFYQAGGALPPNYFLWPKAHVSDGADEHTAVFPVKLPMWFINCGCPKGGLVLDPFAGSGTTGIAARKLGRRAILMEKNLTYEALIYKRVNAAQLSLGQTEEDDADKGRG